MARRKKTESGLDPKADELLKIGTEISNKKKKIMDSPEIPMNKKDAVKTTKKVAEKNNLKYLKESAPKKKPAQEKEKTPVQDPEKPETPRRKPGRPKKAAVLPEAKPVELPAKTEAKKSRRGRRKKSDYKDFPVDETLLSECICIGEYYSKNGIISEIQSQGHRGDIAQVRANDATNKKLHDALLNSILKSKDKRVRILTKKARTTSFSWDWICYSPTTDESVPDGIIRVLSTVPERKTNESGTDSK